MKKIVVGILAHVDSGKTTLSEAMLYLSGTISKLGRVDSKNSFLDTFSLERSRGITIFSKQALLKYKDTDITLIDTPGHVDFSAETERTLQVLDYAILVISATDGVQSHTQTLWKLLAKYNVPCFIFVNKTDLDGADRDVALCQLKTKLSDNCVDFNLLDDELNENIALCDESLLEKYENGTLNKSDVASAVNSRKIFPCMFGSALKLDGVDAFMDLLNDYTEMPAYGTDFGAKVYKISEDKGQRLTMMKITGGSLKVKEVLKSEKNINGEKVNQIRLYSGEKFTAVDEAQAGTVCAVTGITFTNSGDGLGTEDNSSMPVLTPVLTYTVNVPDGTDAHTVLSNMKILESEDPQLKVEWNERYSEIHVKLMGDIQLEVLQTLFAVADSEASKPVHTGLKFELTQNQLRLIGVDGYRLAYKKIECENDTVSGYFGDVAIVIPSKSLNELTKILDDKDEEIKIFCSEKNIRFEFDNVVFTSRLLEGDYLDYKKIIPSEYKTKVKTDVKSVIEAVERASLVITSEVTKAPIILNIVDGEIKINCETQVGKVEEIIPVDMEGNAIEIGFNNRYLLDALKAVSTEEVKLSFIDSVNTCLISPVEGEDFKYIVLPLRLRNE